MRAVCGLVGCPAWILFGDGTAWMMDAGALQRRDPTSTQAPTPPATRRWQKIGGLAGGEDTGEETRGAGERRTEEEMKGEERARGKR